MRCSRYLRIALSSISILFFFVWTNRTSQQQRCWIPTRPCECLSADLRSSWLGYLLRLLDADHWPGHRHGHAPKAVLLARLCDRRIDPGRPTSRPSVHDPRAVTVTVPVAHLAFDPHGQWTVVLQQLGCPGLAHAPSPSRTVGPTYCRASRSAASTSDLAKCVDCVNHVVVLEVVVAVAVAVPAEEKINGDSKGCANGDRVENKTRAHLARGRTIKRWVLSARITSAQITSSQISLARTVPATNNRFIF